MMSPETKLGDDAKQLLETAREGPEPITAAEARRRQRALSKQLQNLYNDVVQEPVPDDLLKVLEQIDEQHAEVIKSE